MSAAASSLVPDCLASEVPVVSPAAPSATTGVGVKTLTARLVAGEEAAWVEFHDQYFDRLLRYLFVLCRGDEQAAREALQAAFVRVARHIRQFEREEALWGWLTVVARSCVIDAARGRSRYRLLLERYAGWFVAPAASAPLAEAPLVEWLDECLKALETGDRALLLAKYRDGEPTAALAERAGCSLKAVESRLARLRHYVKEQLVMRIRREES
jgi:RNA polymerase sigma factor (sigma-70 family)